MGDQYAHEIASGQVKMDGQPESQQTIASWVLFEGLVRVTGTVQVLGCCWLGACALSVGGRPEHSSANSFWSGDKR